MSIEEIYNIIKQNGQRITKQKKMMLSVLADNHDRMLSANQILEKLPEDENINTATVYRNLQSFVDLNILESMIDEKGFTKYAIRCSGEHHHHLICLECGKMISIGCDKDKFNHITEKYGFCEEYHSLEIYGRCKECAKSQK